MAAQSWFDEVRIATTGNISLSGLGAVDGVTPVANDRILVKDQTTASQNGIYVAALGSWSRATDFATTSTVTPEAAVRVSEGTVNAHSEWYLSTEGTIILGTTSLSFSLLRASAGWKDYVRAASNGSNLTLSGTQTIDGVALAVGDRVLVKDQTTSSQNGIYLVASGAWPRAIDGAYSPLVLPETTIRVSEGTTNAHTMWSLTTAAPITLGTTALTFSRQFICVNVKDFGALGNGTNDWTAITNAVNSIPSGGGTLVFPAGTYSVTSSLTIPAAVQVVFEEGALLAPTAAAVTINGRIVAHPTQKIFGGTGFNSLVNHSSGSGPAITVAGNPVGNYAINVRIEATGAVGVATFEYSFDGGKTWSVTQTTTATFPILGTGLTISFPAGPGTYNGPKPGPQDQYSWTASAAITISPTAFETISVMNFGAIGDGVTPCSDAINAAIISLDPLAGGIVQLGFGTYYLDKQIDVDRAVWLRGMGGSPNFPGTNLLVAPGVTAIRCWAAGAPSGNGAPCAYLEGFSITPAGHLSTTGTCDFTAGSGNISVTSGAPNFANGQLVAIEGVGNEINLPHCTAATTHGSATVTVTVSNDTGYSGIVDGMYVVIGTAFPAPTKVLSVVNIGGGVQTWTMTTPADPAPAAGDLSGVAITYCFALLARIVSGGGTASVILDTRDGIRNVTGATITHADAGVELNSLVRIERVHVRTPDNYGFAGPCFVARMSHSYVPPSNGNMWTIESCSGFYGRGCLWVQGIDANGGMASNIVAISGYPGVREFAFVDISLAGNAYYSCHATGGCGYATRWGQYSTTYHSCYSEQGTTSAISSSAMTIGGTMPFHCGGTVMVDGHLNTIVIGVLPDTHHTYFEPASNFFRFRQRGSKGGLFFRSASAAAEGITGYFVWGHQNADGGFRSHPIIISDFDVSTTFTDPIPVPRQDINVASITGIIAGSVLTVNAGSSDEEDIVVQAIVGTTVTAVFKKAHGDNATVTGLGVSTTFTAPISVPEPGQRDINVASMTGITVGSVLTVNAGSSDEEDIVVQAIVGTTVTAVFKKAHDDDATVTGYSATVPGLD